MANNNAMKVKRYNLVPALLLVYLAVMSYVGYPSYRDGRFSATYYFGTIALTVAVIVLLRFLLKKKHDYRLKRGKDTSRR